MTHRSPAIPDVLQQDWSTKYQRVIDAARKFSPSKTVSSLARLATSGDHPFAGLTEAEARVRTPWAIATLAKESLLRGNEHRHGTPPSDWAAQLVRLFNSCSDMRSSQHGLPSLLAPVVFEQYPYQDSIKHELARTIAVFEAIETPAEQKAPRFDWQSVLGCTLKEFVQASLLLSHAAHLHGGHMPRRPRDPDMNEYINEILPPLALEHVTTLLTTTPGDIRATYRNGSK